MGISFAHGGTQNFPGKIIQMKATSNNTEVQLTSSGYLWGAGSSSNISFDMTNTNNNLVVVGMLCLGTNNVNGGLKLLVNGDINDGSGNRYWSGETLSTFSGGSSASNGAFLTPDDSTGCSHEFGIGTNIVIRHSATTLPSGTFNLGWYWYCSSSGEINYNRQDNDNGGSGSSSMIIYEVEDMS
jgi:hypothetical protein